MKTYDCTVIGRSCIDYIVLTKEYPQINTKNPLVEYKICLGGQGANSASVLSYLGLKTLLITPIGNDQNGKLIKNFLSKYKNLNLLISQKNIKTPCAFIWTELKTAKRTILYEKINYSKLYPKNIIEEGFKKSKYILFDHQASKDIYYSKDLIKKHKVNLMMDAERNDKYMFKLLSYINYFIFSEELAKILNLKVKLILKKFINLGPEIVCCTLGEKGAIAICNDNKNKFYYSKGIKVKPKDTTGAGDVFHSAFMYGIIKGLKITEILNFANKLAGLSTKYIGGNEFIKTIKFRFDNISYKILK